MLTTIVSTISLAILALSAVFAQPVAPAAELTPEEAADLAYMREEEKVAQDVYLAFHEQWSLPVFANIAAAEATHMAAVGALLDRYGLADPAAGHPAGVFDDPALQALYDDLVAQGSQSLAAALYVGTIIEEVDILDLEESIARTGQADIKLVYQNLLRGSGNHLRAFVGQWERVTGDTFAPQYLDQAAYEAIMATQSGNGRGGRAGRGGRGGNR
jgi:hypothetical protein